jgi:hypothetical protein
MDGGKTWFKGLRSNKLPASSDSTILYARNVPNRRRHKFKFCQIDVRQILKNFWHLGTLDSNQTTVLLKFKAHVQALTENKIRLMSFSEKNYFTWDSTVSPV